MNNSEEILTDYVIGSSEVARALRERIAQVSDSDVPVLISGPTGAGKSIQLEESMPFLVGKAKLFP